MWLPKTNQFAGDAGEQNAAQAERLVKSGFLNTEGEEYGYYDVRFEVITKNNFSLLARLFGMSGPFMLFGLPIANEQFTLVAHFYIFDSNGNLVKHYSNTDAFKQTVNIYNTGSAPTKKGTRQFSKLFDVIFDEAANDSDAINVALQEAGPVANDANLAEVQANIDRFFLENPYAQNRM